MRPSVRIFLCAAVLIAAGIAWMTGSRSTLQTGTGDLKSLRPDFRRESVGTIRIFWGKHGVTLNRRKDGWTVKEREWPADGKTVQTLLEKVSRLRPVKRILPADKSLLSRLRLEPSDEKNPPLRITFAEEGGTVLYDLMPGKFFYMESSIPATGEKPAPDGQYMGRVMKDGTVHPFLSSGILNEFLPLPGAWVALPSFSSLEKVLQIRFYSRQKDRPSWFLARPGANAFFSLLLPPGRKRVSTQAVRDLFTLLSRRYAADILPGNSSFSAEEDLGTLELADQDGLMRILHFSRSGKRILCRVSASVRPVGGKKNADAEARAEAFSRMSGRVLLIRPDFYETLTGIPEEKSSK